MKAIRITSSGEKSLVEADELTLSELQKAVDGYIELITLPRLGLALWVNENGKLLHLPPNAIATRLWFEDVEKPLSDILLGDVLVTNNGGDDELGMSDEQLAWVFAFALPTC